MFSVFQPEFKERNRTGAILAKTRYDEQLRAFVGKSEARLGYVGSHIETIVRECAAEVEADESYVRDRLHNLIAAELKSDPNGLPSMEVQQEKPSDDGIAHTTVLENEPVLDDSDWGKKYDLNKDQQKWSCVRCSKGLGLVYAASSPVCNDCTVSLLEKNSVPVSPFGVPSQGQQPNPLQDAALMESRPTDMVTCGVCNLPVPQAESKAHLDSHEQYEIDRAMQEKLREQGFGPDGQPLQQMATIKTAQPPMPGGMPGGAPQAPQQQQQAPVQPQQEPVDAFQGLHRTPAGHFTNVIQDYANKGAAFQFSQPDEAMLQQVAQRYGLDSQEAAQHALIVASFGDYIYVNGKPDTNPNIEGMTEVSTDGGTIQAHEVIVQTAAAVKRVADELGTKENYVETVVSDDMGANPPPEFHASVSGNVKVYLPAEMVQVEETPAAPNQQEIGPTPGSGPVPQQQQQQ